MTRNDDTPNDSPKMKAPEESPARLEKLPQYATFADFLRQCYLPEVEAALSPLCPKTKEAIFGPFSRRFEPWPDWTLNIAVEVLRVYVPTISKTHVRSYVRFIHTLIFELKLDGSSPMDLISVPHLDVNVLGALIGHLIAFAEDGRKKTVWLAEKGIISAEERTRFEKNFSQELISKHMAKYLQAQPNLDFAEFCDAVAKARRKTFDPQGGLRETTTTKIYRAILADWPEVESLSGPTELCRFLEPTLMGSGNDPDAKLDRVKKICSRMEIKFATGCQGTTPPPRLSLHGNG